VLERAPERRGHGAGAGADLDDPALGVVAHDHPARIARQALRNFRGNADAVLEHGLAELLGSASTAASTWTTTGAHHERADLGLQAAADDDYAVVVRVDGQGAGAVAAGGLGRLGPAVHLAPAADDALDLGGGGDAAEGEQALFGLRGGHPGEGADLGGGEFTAGQGLGQPGQAAEGAGDADALAGGAEVEAGAGRGFQAGSAGRCRT
jgi:hypothetical protein